MEYSVLQQILKDNKEPNYRFNQIASEIVSGRVNDYSQIFTIPLELREIVKEKIKILSFDHYHVLISSDKKAYKALLFLHDNHSIETVLLNPKPGLWSVCVSSQVGCPMACKFCATGKQGFIRNLTAEEISDQILFWRQYIYLNKIKVRISNIIYMGMGEPFLNIDNVFGSINILTDPKLFGFGARHISVSTCGIVSGIEALAEDLPQVNLAISLHAADDELRGKLMPVNNKFPLEKLMKALQRYLTKTNRQLFFEYLMLSGVNDSDEQIIKLGNLLKTYFNEQLHLIHINLIPYNPVGTEFQGSDKNRQERIRKILSQFQISSTIRKSLGQDIKGACGQLKATL